MKNAHGTLWARAANFLKKPPLFVNATFLELNDFNATIWVFWSPSDPKKLQCIDECIQIYKTCESKHGYDNHIKFEVSLHFWLIWPTVRHPSSDRPVIFAVLRTVFFSPSPRGVTQISFNPPPSTALGGFIFNSGWTLLEIQAFSLLLFLNYKMPVFCFPRISIFNFENQICKLNMMTWEKW